MLEGRTLPCQLKEVSIEDLLNRKPVIPDWRLIRSWLSGKTVMVTGGGGSIGSEVCRQCARHGASRVVIVEIDELALLTIHSDHADCFQILRYFLFLVIAVMLL